MHLDKILKLANSIQNSTDSTEVSVTLIRKSQKQEFLMTRNAVTSFLRGFRIEEAGVEFTTLSGEHPDTQLAIAIFDVVRRLYHHQAVTAVSAVSAVSDVDAYLTECQRIGNAIDKINGDWGCCTIPSHYSIWISASEFHVIYWDTCTTNSRIGLLLSENHKEAEFFALSLHEDEEKRNNLLKLIEACNKALEGQIPIFLLERLVNDGHSLMMRKLHSFDLNEIKYFNEVEGWVSSPTLQIDDNHIIKFSVSTDTEKPPFERVDCDILFYTSEGRVEHLCMETDESPQEFLEHALKSSEKTLAPHLLPTIQCWMVNNSGVISQEMKDYILSFFSGV